MVKVILQKYSRRYARTDHNQESLLIINMWVTVGKVLEFVKIPKSRVEQKVIYFNSNIFFI